MKLDEKTKELIAVGASITAYCQPCLEYHSKKALEFGSDAEEIAEAIEKGNRVRFISEQVKSASHGACLHPVPAGLPPWCVLL